MKYSSNIDTENSIKFYGRTKPDPKYWPFSNFYPASFFYKNKLWKTSEHAYQAMKFENKDIQEVLRTIKSPKEVAELGRELTSIRKDWEEIKLDVMYEVCYNKFDQNEDICKLLLSTGNKLIIEDSPTDYFWGYGANETGNNWLGIVLCKVREDLKNVRSTS